jgi:UDP-glucuronate 4-epimerase
VFDAVAPVRRNRHDIPPLPADQRSGGSPQLSGRSHHEEIRSEMQVFVTGGAGFIGSHLCERLVCEGHHVLAIDNFDPFYDPSVKRRNLAAVMESPRFRLVEADIRDPQELWKAIDREGVASPDLIVHLAAKAGVRTSLEQPVEYTRTNLDGTTSVLELARRTGCRRFIFGSSSSVYGNNVKVPFSEADPVDHPISPYAATKRAGELICHTYHHLHDLSIVCLRFFTVYGPRQRPDLAIHKFTRLMIEGRPVPLYGDGSMERDYTYVDDIVQGMGAAIALTGASDPRFDIVNLGESRTTTTGDLIRYLARELGVEPLVERLPQQAGDVQRTFADITRARRLLGYDPQVPVEAGLPRFVQWFLEESGTTGKAPITI